MPLRGVAEFFFGLLEKQSFHTNSSIQYCFSIEFFRNWSHRYKIDNRSFEDSKYPILLYLATKNPNPQCNGFDFLS